MMSGMNQGKMYSKQGGIRMAGRTAGMFRRMAAALLVFCCVFTLLFPAGVLAGTNVTRVRVVKGGVSLRTGPSEDAPKIRGVHSDYELDVSDERNGWYYVYYKGDWGWVTGRRVTVISRGNSSGNSSSPKSGQSVSSSRSSQQSSGSFRYFSGFGNITVRPNQKLATRSGPATRYDEKAGTFNVDSSVLAMSRSYDAPNNLWWIQFQMIYRGRVYCLYTGEQRFSGLDVSRLPVEKVIGRCTVSMSAEAYYAPCENAARMDWDVPANVSCDIYAMVPGENSDYIQIEFYDHLRSTWRRAWIKEWYADNEYFY